MTKCSEVPYVPIVLEYIVIYCYTLLYIVIEADVSNNNIIK